MSGTLEDWTAHTGGTNSMDFQNGRHAAGKTRSSLNDGMVWPLLLIVFLSALPFGSNRPLFWALWASLLSSAAIVYGVSIRTQSTALYCPPSRYRFLWIPFAAVGLFIAIQTVPLGSVLRVLGAEFDGIGPANTGYLSLTPGNSWLALLRWISYGLLFFLVVQLTGRSSRRQLLLKGLFVIVAVQALYALVALTWLGDTILFFDKWAYEGFATGTFVNRNSLATFLAMGLVIGATHLIAGGSGQTVRRSRNVGSGRAGADVAELTFWGVGSLAILAALLSTQSRMGLAAGICGVVVSIGLGARTSPLSRRIILLAALAALVAFANFGFGFDRFLIVERSAETRGDLYKQIIGMILHRPFAGYGAGSFEFAYPLFHEPPVSIDVVWERAHSTYLQLWSELGIVIGSLPMIMILTLIIVIWRRSCRRGGPKSEQIVLAGATTCVALHSLVDFSLEIEAVAFLFVTILGVGSGALLAQSSANRGREPTAS